jgi:hypothetical protein
VRNNHRKAGGFPFLMLLMIKLKIQGFESIPTDCDIYGPRFAKGKIRVEWSQTRAGYAVFLSGRMEGPLFIDAHDAFDWLINELGISSKRIEIKR